MRSLAVFLVVLDHNSRPLGYAHAGGYHVAWLGVFGVYLFFVHTSLVLMWSLERQPHVLNFYIRRVFRIYPLAIAAILIAVAFKIPLSPTPTNLFALGSLSVKNIIFNLLLIQDLRGTNIVGVMWSLGMEMQMYLVLPILFLYAFHERRIWQFVILWVFAIAVAYTFASTDGNSLLVVAPDFIPGVVAFVAFSKFKARFPAWTFPLFLLLLMAIFMRNPGPARSWPLMLCLGLMLPLFRSIRMPALVRASHTVAKYSYGVYLSHFFGIVLAFDLLKGLNRWLQLSVELIFTAIVSVAAYHLIEEPMIHLGSRLAKANDRRESARALTA